MKKIQNVDNQNQNATRPRGGDKKILIQKNFKKVLDLVEEGLTIYEALKFLNIEKSTFYRNITKRQKIILNEVKTANSLYIQVRPIY